MTGLFDLVSERMLWCHKIRADAIVYGVQLRIRPPEIYLTGQYEREFPEGFSGVYMGCTDEFLTPAVPQQTEGLGI